MAKVFAIANQKGGVGKTTTCINLAASLVATKRRVLLIDLDPQGNATMGSGVDKHGLENSVYDLLIGECDLAQAMHISEHGGYQLLPANRDLTAAEVVLLEMQMKESRLRTALAPEAVSSKCTRSADTMPRWAAEHLTAAISITRAAARTASWPLKSYCTCNGPSPAGNTMRTVSAAMAAVLLTVENSAFTGSPPANACWIANWQLVSGLAWTPASTNSTLTVPSEPR